MYRPDKATDESRFVGAITYALTFVILGCVLLLALAACAPAPIESQSDIPRVDEHEDCDAEDFRNREAECGFAPAPKTKKPTPRRTR